MLRGEVSTWRSNLLWTAFVFKNEEVNFSKGETVCSLLPPSAEHRHNSWLKTTSPSSSSHPQAVLLQYKYTHPQHVCGSLQSLGVTRDMKSLENTTRLLINNHGIDLSMWPCRHALSWSCFSGLWFKRVFECNSQSSDADIRKRDRTHKHVVFIERRAIDQ